MRASANNPVPSDRRTMSKLKESEPMVDRASPHDEVNKTAEEVVQSIPLTQQDYDNNRK